MTGMHSRRTVALFALAVAVLVAALGGTATAGKGKVGTKDLENGAVTTKKIAKQAVGNKQIKKESIKGNRIKDGAINAAKIADGVITAVHVASEGLSSENISDYAVVSSPPNGYVKLTATEGADQATARAAAPATTLFSKGQITISAKCFRDTVSRHDVRRDLCGDERRRSHHGGVRPTTGTAATRRPTSSTPRHRISIGSSTIPLSTGADANQDEGEFSIVAPDGTHLLGQNMIAAKNGNLAGGNGVYGAGNVCLFGAEISG